MSNTDFENLREHAKRGDYTNAHLARRVQELEAALDAAQDDAAAVKHAAHMPDDYAHGLPAWIMRLYACYIGADISPEIQNQIESGYLTFPNAPVWKRVAQLEANDPPGNVTFRIMNECGLPGNANSGTLYDRCQHIAAVLRAAQDDAAREHELRKRAMACATEYINAASAYRNDVMMLRAVILKSPEWVYNRNENDGWCVHCERWYTEGHRPDCQRQAALAQTGGEVKA